jgi:DNA-binding protein WhiA
VRLVTENAAVARRIKTLLSERFSADASLLVGEHSFARGRRAYALHLSGKRGGNRILRETDIVKPAGSRRHMEEGLSERFFRKKCCRKALLRGLFLGAGTVSDPKSGYNLELVFADEATAASARKLFGSFTDLKAGVRQRRGRIVVYLKDSEQIKDVLTIMGAHAKLLAFEDVRLMKELRGRTNRVNNCELANVDRALATSSRELDAIQSIRRRNLLDELPSGLLDTALIRLDHPDATLAELGALHTPPIGKSAVSARMKRIEKFAEEG